MIELTKSMVGEVHPRLIEKKIDSFREYIEQKHGIANVIFDESMNNEMFGVKYSQTNHKGETTLTVKFKATENGN